MLPPAARSTIVDASDAAAHVGSTASVEGDVTEARIDDGTLVLELAPVGTQGFRAVLVLSLISSLPRSPDRIYAGKRVRVTGLVQRFQGRPEMVIESPGQIEVVDIAGAPVTASTTTTVTTPSTTTASGATTSAPLAAPSPAPFEAPPIAPPRTAMPVAQTAPPAATEPPPAKPLLAERLAAAACERARERWQAMATRSREAAAALTRCLDAGAYACRTTAAALAPIVADLEWAEQQVADRCD